MAAHAVVGDRECHFAMAESAVFSGEHLGHGDVVAAFFLYEELGVAVGAVQPLSVRFVAKAYMGHLGSIGEDDIQVERCRGFGLSCFI